MALTPTSITLFLVQIGTFFSNVIVAICCGLYVSSYPKSPEPQALSPIALGTLAFACLSSLVTLLLILRQKSGKTMRAIFEAAWIFFAIAMWILAAIGGIIKPPNGMSNVSCKVLPDGKETSDGNFIRACQAMFASTAFCIVSALFFIVTAVMLFVFSVKSSVRNRKNRKNQVGGHYKLTTTLSQYRRAEKEDAEEAKRLKGAGEHEEAASAGEGVEGHSSAAASGQNSAAATTIDLSDAHFSDRVYRDPYISAIPTALPTGMSSPAPPTPYYSPYPASGSSNANNSSGQDNNKINNAGAHLAFLKKEQFNVHNQPREENERQQEQLQQQQQQQQHQYQQQQQQQQSWSQQQPTFGGY